MIKSDYSGLHKTKENKKKSSRVANERWKSMKRTAQHTTHNNKCVRVQSITHREDIRYIDGGSLAASWFC